MKGTTAEERAYYALLKKVFDVLAPFYDLATLPLALTREKVAASTGGGTGEKILDVATGTGKQALAFARRGFDVIGVDVSAAMLRVARRNAPRGSVRFEAADATDLRFPDASFDLSTVSFALHDMPTSIRERTLRKMVRVTKRKGTIVIVDYALPRGKFRRFLIYHFVKLFEREYYVDFIHSDLEALLRKTGIHVCERVRAMVGAVRILIGTSNERY